MVPFMVKQRVLSVTLDSHLLFDEPISVVVHRRALRHIHPLIDQDVANTVACFIVLDYCNSIFYEVSESNIYRLQHVQNTLACGKCTAPYRSPATHLRQSLYWLLIRQCITYKMANVNIQSSATPSTGWTRWPYCRLLTISISTFSRQTSTRRSEVQDANCLTGNRVSAPSIWNDLSIDIWLTATLISFCR